MSQNDFVIKRGNLLPIIESTLKDADGNAIDLTGLAVKFVMRPVSATTAKVFANAVVDPDQVTNKGKVTYTWVAADVDTVGVFYAEWEVTFAGPKPLTFPNDRQIIITVTERAR